MENVGWVKVTKPNTHQLPIVLKPNLAIVNDRLLALAYNLCWVSRGDVPVTELVEVWNVSTQPTFYLGMIKLRFAKL